MKTRSSPYTKLFWDEYQLNPLRNDYNIIFDQHIVGYLNIEKLKSALFSLIENHILLNSHLIILKIKRKKKFNRTQIKLIQISILIKCMMD